MLVFAWEVTEQVHARGHLEKARRQAEEASLAKDQFLAMLGHELRNPLSPILTALQLMKLRGDRSRRERRSSNARSAIWSGWSTTCSTSPRITRGKVELRREPVEIAGIVVRGIETGQPAAGATQAAPRGQRAAGRDAGERDCDRLAQVVSNLLTNAAKYSEPGGAHLTSRPPGPAANVGQGCSCASATKGSASRPTCWTRSSSRSCSSGRRWIGRPAGWAWAWPSCAAWCGCTAGRSPPTATGPGNGSEFRVELPLPDDDVVAVVDATDESGPHSAARAPDVVSSDRVLVVDDNRTAPRSWPKLCASWAIIGRVAHDGPSALADRPALQAADRPAGHRPAGDGRLRAGPAPARADRTAPRHPAGRGHRLRPGVGPRALGRGRLRRPPGQAGQSRCLDQCASGATEARAAWATGSRRP